MNASASALPTLLGYVMVVAALGISAVGTLREMSSLYRVQAAALTLLVVVQGVRGAPVLLVLAIVPAGLAVLAPLLLARASLLSSNAPPGVGRRPVIAWYLLLEDRHRAEPVWLRHGASRITGARTAAAEASLIAAAVLVSGRLAPPDGAPHAYYTATLALLAQGMFIMVNKRDVVAQVIGLLVLDHALLLGAVLLAPRALVTTFVVGLLFYVVLTLTILGWALPALHRATGSILVGDQTRLRG